MSKRRITPLADGYYTFYQVAIITGVKERTIKDWVHKSVIRPIERSGVRGSATRLSYRNVLEVALIGQMRHTASLGIVRAAIEKLDHQAWDSPTDTLWLEVQNSRSVRLLYEVPMLGQVSGLYVDVLALKDQVRKSTMACFGWRVAA